MRETIRLVEAGQVTPVITEVYPLKEVAAAETRLETGHNRGKVCWRPLAAAFTVRSR